MMLINPYVFVITGNPLWDSLFAVYKAESNANDSLGVYNGTANGGLTYGTGKSGNAFVFNGTNAYVGLGSNNFKFTNDFSISFWVYIPSIATATNGIFANYTNQTGPKGFIAYLKSDGKFEFYVSGVNGVSTATTTAQIPTGWTHVGVFRKMTSNKETFVYINGVLDAQSGINNAITLDFYTTTNPSIGAIDSISGGAQDLFGFMMNNSKIDELYIWDREVTSSEFTELYNSGSGTYYNPIVYDVDAQAFITATGITDTTQKNAINQLVLDLKSANIWTKMKAIYPFVGGTATTHKFNLKDPRDLDAAFRLVFNGGWTHTSTGALPNGTSAYADTYLIPSTSLTNNSSHLSYYSRTNRGYRNSVAIGSYQGSPTYNNIDLRFYANGYNGVPNKTASAQYDGFNSLDYADYTPTTTACFGIASKTAVNLNKIYENGILKGSNTNTSTRTLPNVRTLIGAISNGSSGVISYDNLESAFASIGDGLTDAEASNFYTAVQAYQTTLGRQV